MPFQWLQVRISEEQDRRKREAAVLSMLPAALADLHRMLSECVEAYGEAFGKTAADITFNAGTIRVTMRQPQGDKLEPGANVEIVSVEELPGFKVEHGSGEPMMIEVGLLPGDKLFYRNNDEFLTVEELTRRILDRAMFPKLRE